MAQDRKRHGLTSRAAQWLTPRPEIAGARPGWLVGVIAPSLRAWA